MDKIRLFYGGRLYYGKGILELLKSMDYLTRKLGFESYQLEVFGRGPLERKVRESTLSSNLARNVKLRGFVERRELMASMATSDIVCIPSKYEVCPLTMMEAMALGKPVVTFDRAFSRELLGGDPELPLAKSVEDYAKNLYALCTSEDLRKKIGNRMQSQAREKFDIKTTARNYSKIYSDIS
jgi:glycosyltransferase involved in cell wall biosynthesis